MKTLRYAIRSLRARPFANGLAVATLAVVLGANSVLFAVVGAVLLRPLAYSDPDELVIVWERHEELGVEEATASFPNFLDWQRSSGAFEDLGVFQYAPFEYSGSDLPERVWGVRVTTNIFSLLGVRPDHGRGLHADDALGGDAVVVSHRFWRDRMGRRADPAGASIRLDGVPRTVVGVMPEGFQFPPSLRFGGRTVPLSIDVWVPIVPGAAEDNRSFRFYFPVGRLADGVSLAEAQLRLDATSRDLAARHPDVDGGWTTQIVPLREQSVGHTRTTLMALWGAVALVVLLACVNIASLLLAEAMRRRRELSLRSAVGARPRDLMAQLMTESLLLALAGGGLGLLVATLVLRGVRNLEAADLPRLASVAVDPSVALFTFATTLLTALLVGVVPALRMRRPDLAQSLSISQATTGGRRGQRLQKLLVAVEIALALALTTGALLIAQGHQRLVDRQLGFDGSDVLAGEVFLTAGRYPDAAAIRTFHRRLAEELQALPGTVASGLINVLPLTEHNMRINVAIEGRPVTRPADQPGAEYRAITPGYLDAMDIALVEGRAPRAGDAEGAPLVAWVNETMAARHWPDGTPVGARLEVEPMWPAARGLPPTDDERPVEIVGVLSDVAVFGPAEPVEPMVYVPIEQDPWPLLFPVLEVEGDPRALIGSLRRAVARLDAEQPVIHIETLASRQRRVLARSLLTLRLFVAFSLVAVALAALGTFALVHHGVVVRMRELGVRRALGSRDASIARLVLRDASLPVALGIGLGIGLTLTLAPFLGDLLHSTPVDAPLVLALGIGVILASAVPALLLPIRQAIRLDPADILHRFRQ